MERRMSQQKNSPVQGWWLGLLSLCLCAALSSQAQVYTGELKVPEGFSVHEFTTPESRIPFARSLAVSENGTVFVGTWNQAQGALTQVYALLDEDGDGKVDRRLPITKGLVIPNGITLHQGDLYVALVDRVHVFRDVEAHMEDGPRDPDETIIGPDDEPSDLPQQEHHHWRYILADEVEDKLYIAVGAPCNIPNDDYPDCLEDERFGTIVRTNMDGTDMEIYAKGIRNTLGFAFHPQTHDLWFTDNGRDSWGDDQPPDELNRVPSAESPGLHFGFPFCYGKDLVDPEFNEDGHCDPFQPAVAELPAHAAALGMRFYTPPEDDDDDDEDDEGQAKENDVSFPAEFAGHIFIAEHGSWDRSPPAGYRVERLNMSSEGQFFDSEVFLDGFLPHRECEENSDCPGLSTCQKRQGRTPHFCSGWGRPVDLAFLPDGSLIVSDDRTGAVYRIVAGVEVPPPEDDDRYPPPSEGGGGGKSVVERVWFQAMLGVLGGLLLLSVTCWWFCCRRPRAATERKPIATSPLVTYDPYGGSSSANRSF